MQTKVAIPKDKIVPILAIDRAALENTLELPNGYNRVPSLKELLETPSIQGAYVIRRRLELEKNPSYMQLLPYVTVLRMNKQTGRYDVYLYQRTKLVGEDRLGGSYSIGFGGHVDLSDVCHSEDAGLDPWATVRTNVYRELTEELAFTDGQGIRLDYELGSEYVGHGLITEYSDEIVGKFHVAIHLSIIVPEDWEVTVREDVLIGCGFKDLETVAATQGLENWSRLILGSLESFEEMVAHSNRSDF